MELLEFIAKLAKPQTINDLERYWRVIVNCFLVEKLEQLELGSLPSKFKQYYGRLPTYDGKLSVLLQEPEFKAICTIVRRNSAASIRPSEFILRVLRAPDPKSLILSNVLNNNNTNVMHPMNPFARDALEEIGQKDKESSDQLYETRFGRLTLEELNCAICFDLLKEAVEGNCCKNIFCLPCIEQNGRKCPNCRKIVEWTANEPIRRLIRKKPVQCEFKDCNAWSTVSEIEQHRVKCEFNPENLLVSCQKCQQRIMRRLIEEHLSNTCEMNDVPCSSCNFRIMRKDLANHEEQDCEYRRVACAHGCGEHMTYKEYIDSHFNRCSHQPIKCTNHKCSLLVQRRRMDFHLQECKHSMLPCQHRARGCEVEYTVAQKTAWRKHATVCRYMPVQCPYGCGLEMHKHKVKGHHCLHMPMRCPHCNSEFKKFLLANHVDICPSRMVKCELCEQSVVYEALDQHKVKECPDRLVACTKCQKYLAYSTLESHVMSSCPRRIVWCDKCIRAVIAEELDFHLSYTCSRRKVPCKSCKDMVVCDDMAWHMQSQCPKRRVECPDCQKFLDACNLDRHRFSRCPERLIECELCHEDIAAIDMNEHEEDECPLRSVRCPSCTEWVTARLLSIHQSTSCRYKPVKCSKCDESVALCLLPNHQSTRCPERILKCPDCGTYVYARGLSLHRSQVCAYRDVTCDDCDARMTASDLAYHLAHKCSERQVPCKCGSAYPARVIGLHQLYDCDLRLVTCSLCPKSVYARDLQTHKKECPARIVTCEKCSNIMTLRTFESHQCNSGCNIS